MKKENRLVIVSAAAVFLVFAVVLVCLQAARPRHQDLLKGLDVSDVESISIYEPYGEQRKAQLSEEDVSDIVRQLNTVNLTGSGTKDYADDFLLGYAMYHIRLKDGMEFDFTAWFPGEQPYYIINTENFGERFGRSLGDECAATGSGYRIEPGARTGCFDLGYNYNVCKQLQKTYNSLCRAYFYGEGV